MKRLALPLLLCLPTGCGLFGSRQVDSETTIFLAAVHTTTQEHQAYVTQDATITEDVARERLIRDEAIERRIALILGEKARKD